MFQINPATSERAVANALVASRGLSAWLQKVASGFGPATPAADLSALNEAVEHLLSALRDTTTSGPVLPLASTMLSATPGLASLRDNDATKQMMELMRK